MTPEALAQVHRAAFGEAGWSADDFARYAADPSAILCHQPGALALVRVVADEAEVLTLATVPEARRGGLARTLLSEALAETTRRGATRAFLEVAADNTAAIGLYTALGFTKIAERRDYYRRPDGGRTTALVMARDL